MVQESGAQGQRAPEKKGKKESDAGVAGTLLSGHTRENDRVSTG
jgi:hypothetical protein